MSSEGKFYELEEVKRHTREEDCWLVINGNVYDVTKFLDEHPGGFDIILANTGKDATEDYEEIGHSKSAHELLENYKIGQYKGGQSSAAKASRSSAVAVSKASESSLLITVLKVLLPFVVLAAIFAPKLLKSD